MRMLADPSRLTDAPVRFQTVVGTVYTVALQYPTGKLYPSTKPGLPDSVMYTLVDGRRAWFPVEVSRLIDSLHLQPREPFTVCNLGARRGWQVLRKPPTTFEEPPAAPDTPEPPPMPPAAATRTESRPVTKLENALKTAIAAVVQAERFSDELGHPVRFDADAIRAMAITLVIEGGRNAAR